jgi:hypothetical protein
MPCSEFVDGIDVLVLFFVEIFGFFDFIYSIVHNLHSK